MQCIDTLFCFPVREVHEAACGLISAAKKTRGALAKGTGAKDGRTYDMMFPRLIQRS